MRNSLAITLEAARASVITIDVCDTDMGGNNQKIGQLISRSCPLNLGGDL